MKPAIRRASRRGFLRRAAAVAGVASVAAPVVVRAQGPVVMRLQSTWPSKDILHEYALDFAKKVNDMSGGDVRLDILPAGTVVQPFGLLAAVSSGSLDGGHGSLEHHYAKHPAFALWSAGPAFGMDANLLLSWHKYGGGRQLLAKLYATINAEVVSFPYGPMPTPPLGWFKRAITGAADFEQLNFRAVGMAIGIFTALGARVNALSGPDIASALQRGIVDGAQYHNITSDRALGLADHANVCMLQSYHGSAEQLEVIFNKARFDALPARIRAVIEHGVEAASQDLSWKAIERYSRDHAELSQSPGRRFLKTPDAVLTRQLEAYDEVAGRFRRDPLFAEIEQSQRRYAERVVRWQLDTQVSPRLAYRHYFARPPSPRQPAKRSK
jgi:TRAP-type mannitol/chloroaromatic compound transport system substrate-binding protein